jgi:hypothetical protein
MNRTIAPISLLIVVFVLGIFVPSAITIILLLTGN